MEQIHATFMSWKQLKLNGNLVIVVVVVGVVVVVVVIVVYRNDIVLSM